MRRLRRFEHIEGSREPKAAEDQAARRLPRFEDAPVSGEAREAGEGSEGSEPGAREALAAPVPPRSEAAWEALRERLVAAMPSLECPACGVENSKFSRSCRSCQHPLDGEDALTHNERLLERREQERLVAEVALERQLTRAVVTKAEVDPLAPASSGLPPPPSRRATLGLSVGLLLLTLLTRSVPVTVACTLAALGLGGWWLLAGPGSGPRTPPRGPLTPP